MLAARSNKSGEAGVKYSQAGIIQFVQRYAECVAFYGEVLELPVLFRLERAESTLTVFDLGGAYLMVEPGGAPGGARRGPGRSPVKLRFNVANVESAAAELRGKGVEVALRRHDWGTTAEFADPDGNRCALRSEAGFGA